METTRNKTERKAKIKMGWWRERRFEEDGSKQLETEGTGKETMKRNNWASQNSQRVVELRKKKKEYFLRGKASRCLEFKNFPHLYADFHEIWEP